MLSRPQLIQLVITDQTLSYQDYSTQYSPTILDIAFDHKDEICTNYLCSDLLVSNFCRFRFASNPNGQVNYYPQKLGDDLHFMNFLMVAVLY